MANAIESFSDVGYGRKVTVECAVVSRVKRDMTGRYVDIRALREYWESISAFDARFYSQAHSEDDVLRIEGRLRKDEHRRWFDGHVVKDVGRSNDPRILLRKKRYADMRARGVIRGPDASSREEGLL